MKKQLKNKSKNKQVRKSAITGIKKSSTRYNYYFSLIILLLFTNHRNSFAQLDCSSAVTLTTGLVYQGNTVNGNSNVSTYNNDPWWKLTGPEIVHKLVWPGGNISINLTNKSAALDLILLNSCNKDSGFIASGGGNSGTQNSQINLYLPSGTYYIVVDGWQLAAGSYDLQVVKSISIGANTFVLSGDTVSKVMGSTSAVIATGVVEMNKYFGRVTNTITGDGIEEEILSIKKIGQVKPKIYLNNNFNTDYLKQILFCNQKTLYLYGDLVFDGTTQILTGCDILRNENGFILSHQKDATIKLFNVSNNSWTDILQIITIDSKSYYINASDSSVWALSDNGQASKIASKAVLLQDNDNQLIKIDVTGNYQRYLKSNNQWSSITPKYVGASPKMTDEGFWFFIQSKVLLESADYTVDQKKGLTYDGNEKLVMELIPASGNCDRFLWRTKDAGNGKFYLINKVKGEANPLSISAFGMTSFTTNALGCDKLDINYSNQAIYGTNAFKITGVFGTKSLAFSNNNVLTQFPIGREIDQTWVFQFNQMVKDYFLPLPTKDNLTLYYENPNININQSAPEIQKNYNKFLKGTNGVSIFGTNTSSDWVVVNHYFLINNMMNAVVSPKPSDPAVNPTLVKTLAEMKGRSIILINKNDLNYAIPNHFFTKSEYGYSAEFVSVTRGGAAYLSMAEGILVSEELTCKKGIINRPLDKTFRRFDHGVHEFTHGLQELCNWIPIIDANNICPYERNRSSECFCFKTQAWFNSDVVGNVSWHPGLRATDLNTANFMQKIFNGTNTWMPPLDLRTDGYNPSGSSGLFDNTIGRSSNNFSSNSINELLDEEIRINVYPNPFTDLLNVEVNLTTADKLEVEIMDVTGRLIKKIKSNELADKHVIEIKNLNYKGVLFIKVSANNVNNVTKVIGQQ
ncbi:MAG: T9SS type A sorting domain-containing protein [Bacteroidota bacterium]|nr:T9SS type A sorting domain-containing protein [Bacteroidota bacterium]